MLCLLVRHLLVFASFFGLTATQNRWADDDTIPLPLPEGALDALSKDQLKDVARETSVWKLDVHEKRMILESFYRRRHDTDFDQDAEDKRM